MARMLTAVRQVVSVVDGMFGLVDVAHAGEGPPDRLPGGEWIRVGPGAVFLATADSLILQAEMRVEVWDGPVEIDAAGWPDQACLSLDLPTARFFVDESDAGTSPGPDLPSPG